MRERFHYEEISSGAEIELTGAEAHHALHVLRMKPGQVVELFDGRGGVGPAEIVAIGRRSLTLRVSEVRRDAEPSGGGLVLGVAVPKGDRFRWLVEKATELGVSTLVPLELERSVVDPGAGKLDKLRQTVVAACKQSGRNRLMEIAEPLSWQRFLDQTCAGRTLLVAHPGGDFLASVLGDASPETRWAAAIGPEGGFTDAEIEQARSRGAMIVALGGGILRIETAAVAIAAVFDAMGERTGGRGWSDGKERNPGLGTIAKFRRVQLAQRRKDRGFAKTLQPPATRTRTAKAMQPHLAPRNQGGCNCEELSRLS